MGFLRQKCQQSQMSLNMERPVKSHEQWTLVLPSSIICVFLPVMDYHQIIDHMRLKSFQSYLTCGFQKSTIQTNSIISISPSLSCTNLQPQLPKRSVIRWFFSIKDCSVQLQKEILVLQSFDFFGIGYLGSSEAYYHRKLVGHMLLHG